ncbi:hypothetical protein [Nonlabens sp. Asnod3-A02]|uniref:hypothetical protein n=1 Tax=Nonlabens sp. Asnod3-A02 TaxID=3160579 RepID=UPI0038642C0F
MKNNIKLFITFLGTIFLITIQSCSQLSELEQISKRLKEAPIDSEQEFSGYVTFMEVSWKDTKRHTMGSGKDMELTEDGELLSDFKTIRITVYEEKGKSLGILLSTDNNEFDMLSKYDYQTLKSKNQRVRLNLTARKVDDGVWRLAKLTSFSLEEGTPIIVL